MGFTKQFKRGLQKSRREKLQVTVKLAADLKNGVVVMNFGKPIAWLTLPKETALNIARGLIEKANELPDTQAEPVNESTETH